MAFVDIPATVRTTWIMAPLRDTTGDVALVKLTQGHDDARPHCLG